MTTIAKHRRRRWATCLIVAVAACSSSDDAGPIDGREAPSEARRELAADPEITLPPATTTPRMPNAASAELLRQERRYALPDPLGSLQLEHGVAPVQLGPGEYVADSLGIETTLRLDRWWRLEAEEVGSFWLTRPDAPVGGLLPVVIFLRPVGLAPVTRVAEADFTSGEHSVPPDDLGGWLDAVPQLEVLDRGSITVGDRVGEWFDVDVRDDAGPLIRECSPDPCIHTWWSGGSRSTVARDGESLRYYSFPDPAGPIYVLVASADEEFEEWNALTFDLLTASEFGESAPHPVAPGTSAGAERVHEAGSTWRFTTFPGLTVRAERYSFSFQAPGRLEFQPFHGLDLGTRAAIVRPVATFDGQPLGDVDDVIAALAGAGLSPSRDQIDIPRSVALFDGVVEGPILRRAEILPGDDPAFVRWPEFSQTRLRIWVLDTELGPLLLTAEGDSDVELGNAITQAEVLGRSIEFD